jgi:hypothetical protein
MMPNDYFNPRQMEDLKRTGLYSLLGGSGLALLKHLNSGSLLADTASNLGAPSGSMVEVPVPGQSAIPGTSEFFENRRKRKIKGKAKNLGTYKPGKNISMEKESKFQPDDLANPYYLSAALAAAAVPAVGGYSLINHLLTKKVKAEKDQELADAKSEFGKALVEAHSNRLSAPISAVKSASLAEDLEKLAEFHSEGEKQAKDPLWELGGNLVSGVTALGRGLKNNTPNPMDVLKGYGGAVGALGLGLGTAGIYTGFQDAKKNDTEKLESQRYLNEFLNRRAIEGQPIYSIPVPVAVNKKKKTLRPSGNVDDTLEYEA